MPGRLPLGFAILFAMVGVQSALSQTLGRDQRVSRDLWLFQNSAAELQDRYGAAAGAIQVIDLPAPPAPGSCDVPGTQASRMDYPRQGLDWERGQQVKIWVRDSSLGSPFQTASVAWREPLRYGLTLESGQTLPWQPGDDWAQALLEPASLPGLQIQVESTDQLILRCAVPGPSWQARYQGTGVNGRLDLALDALIQIPPSQQWGWANVTLSSQVGRGAQPRAMRAELMASAADSAGESVSDGIWQYRLEQPLELSAGQSFTQRLWQDSLPIERVHRLQAFLSARNNQREQNLRASRAWLIKNTSERALPAGALRINDSQDGRYPLVGQAFMPDLAPGAQHWLALGPSLAVSGRLTRIEQKVTQGEVTSTWQIQVKNASDEAVTVELNFQASPRAQLTANTQRLQLDADAERVLTMTLKEPR